MGTWTSDIISLSINILICQMVKTAVTTHKVAVKGREKDDCKVLNVLPDGWQVPPKLRAWFSGTEGWIKE